MIRLLLAALICAVTGCGLVGGDEVDAGDADAALEQQRDDVRALTRELTAASEGVVGASVRTATGRWEGCDSAFNETYRNYRYLTQVRLDVAADTGDLPAALAPVVTDSGLSVDADASEPAKLRASGNGLSVSFWALPDATEGDLLLTVHGECVDVAEDERDEWLEREETEPDPLA